MFDINEFIDFIKNNNVSGISNPVSDLDTISLQDLKILFEEYENSHS